MFCETDRYYVSIDRTTLPLTSDRSALDVMKGLITILDFNNVLVSLDPFCRPLDFIL
jgi:hypothetical protein